MNYLPLLFARNYPLSQPYKKIRIFGRFYSIYSPRSLYGWLKFPFKNCIVNGSFSSSEINEIYNSSKICLNIQHKQNKSGYNPRTIEIMASGSFQLSNFTQGMRKNHWDDIIGEYKDEQDLVSKVKFYLEQDMLRKKMAESARLQVSGMEYFSKVDEIIS